jgi:hypothetical protein
MDEENGIVGIRVANPTPGEDWFSAFGRDCFQ